MKDTLIKDIEGIYATVSIHRQNTEKLRLVIDTLLGWMEENLPPDDFILPFNCKLYPSGDFEYTPCKESSVQKSFTLYKGLKHSVSDLNLFSTLIKDGFMAKLIEGLEQQSKFFSDTVSDLKNAMR